jgi:hypothetical protein
VPVVKWSPWWIYHINDNKKEIENQIKEIPHLLPNLSDNMEENTPHAQMYPGIVDAVEPAISVHKMGGP